VDHYNLAMAAAVVVERSSFSTTMLRAHLVRKPRLAARQALAAMVVRLV
jgi:hypothetical protein